MNEKQLIHQTQREIESSRKQIEFALMAAEDRIRGVSEQVREIGFKAFDTLRSAEGFVRQNSIPVAAIALIGGYMIGSQLNQRVQQRSRQPVEPGMRRRTLPDSSVSYIHGTSGGEMPPVDELESKDRAA